MWRRVSGVAICVDLKWRALPQRQQLARVALCQPVLAQGSSDNGSSAYNWSGLSGGGFGSGLFGGGDLASALGNGSPCLAGPCYAAANVHLHDRATGGGGGLQLGYNVRSGGFLYGLEIDAMAQRLTASKEPARSTPSRPTPSTTRSTPAGWAPCVAGSARSWVARCFM